MSGILLAVEGGSEGSGKTTQARALHARLQQMGYDVVLTREPGGSPSAERLRNVVVSGAPQDYSALSELLIFTAARREHLRQTIMPAMARGAVVITDRYLGSTLAIQGHGRGVDPGLIRSLHTQFCDGFEATATLFLDVTPEAGLKRALARIESSGSTENRFEREGMDFHRRVYEGFRLEAARNPTWITIPGDGSVEEVHARILDAAMAILRPRPHLLPVSPDLIEMQGPA